MVFHFPKIFAVILFLEFARRPANAQFWQYSICSLNVSDGDFQSNLNNVLGNIGTKALNNSDYFNDTVGMEPSQVYGLIMCYADANRTSCNDCLSAPTALQITRKCPISKSAAFWGVNPDSCLIRYSNDSYFSVADSTVLWAVSNDSNFSNPELLNNTLKTLFGRLITDASTSQNLLASGEENITATDKLYGLLQCTRDLNSTECSRCLNAFVAYLLEVYGTTIKPGLRLHGYSCFLRYEIYAFMPTDSPGGNKSNTSPTVTGGKKSHTTLIAAVVACVAAFLIITAIFIWFQRKWSQVDGTKSTSPLINELQEIKSLEFFIYDLTALSIATDDFSDKNNLGQGGFGAVYKGTLPNGQEVAVKRLSKSSTQGAAEFKNEVDLLVRLRHNNLVQLLGCCVSKDERMLCYEYLPNGSLDKTLFATDDVKSGWLNWTNRFKIIKGICRGLFYLHEESPLKIVHRDLKASNILLDRDMNPKISDFGLARLFDRDKTHTVTANVAGTFGYIAPEYSIRGTFSVKSDAYSFGILVLEIVTGRKNSSFPGSRYMTGVTNFVWKYWSEGKVEELKDPTLEEECIEEVRRCIHVALLCLQANPSNRPNMEAVAHMLSSSSIANLPPLPPPESIWGADTSMFDDYDDDDDDYDDKYSVNLSTIAAVEAAHNSSF
ncbi:Cysteine-rich receptor-kinase-like protein [Rhynchospora pubera]|uniref:non-specific serine/threonine protein kinase n=1 Tax=Rhynchospora pubera TaxID=906938 RepID=A0AAV8FH19_9POAL|nr:Cysteine-rich receptor-kinase-like protein [Rhynchospora pubera]KAJ4809419.1 Cysteine-rich receptor-kinase-like protein [Rhynchospora pubera]